MFKDLVPPDGIEPSTSSLPMMRSTPELRRPDINYEAQDAIWR